MIKLKNAVIGGTRVIISIENLEPIIVYDLKRKRSPNTNPTNPDSDNQIQLSQLASTGKIKPFLIRLKTLRKANPIISLRIFTATDPILWLADSNAREVMVQKIAVSKAANSPICSLKKIIIQSV
jgi:hypothetical protein